MRLIWTYDPSDVEREVAEEWIADCDTSSVVEIDIADGSVTMSATDGTFVSVSRQWDDLAADLDEAARSLRHDLRHDPGSTST